MPSERFRSSTPWPSLAGKHGASGYKKGCGCLVCRRGHRDEQNRYTARKRKEAAKVFAPRPSAECGEIERAILGQVASLKVAGPEAEMLVIIARMNARNMDLIVKEKKMHLMASAQRTLLDAMDRLRGLTMPKALPETEPGDDEFDLASLGSPES